MSNEPCSSKYSKHSRIKGGTSDKLGGSALPNTFVEDGEGGGGDVGVSESSPSSLSFDELPFSEVFKLLVLSFITPTILLKAWLAFSLVAIGAEAQFQNEFQASIIQAASCNTHL